MTRLAHAFGFTATPVASTLIMVALLFFLPLTLPALLITAGVALCMPVSGRHEAMTPALI
jgi:hypothetical protein